MAEAFDDLEEIEMIEVKQGPYAGDGDKTRFAGITANIPTSDEFYMGAYKLRAAFDSDLRSRIAKPSYWPDRYPQLDREEG